MSRSKAEWQADADHCRERAAWEALDPVGVPGFWLNEAAFCDIAADLTD
jgi:hypothetical protein